MKLKDLIFEIKYPPSSRKWSKETPYHFWAYVNDMLDKHHSDYYSLSNAKKMDKILKKSGDTYEWQKGEDAQYSNSTRDI